MRQLRLDFDDPELEREFLERDDEDARPRRVIGLALGAALFAGFGLLDRYFTGDDAADLIPLRLLVPTWMVLVIAAISQRRFDPQRRLWLMYSAVLAANWGIAVAPFIAGFPPSALTGGSILGSIALFGFVGVRAHDIPLMSALVLGGWSVAAVFHGGDYRLVITNAIFMFGSVIFGAIASYTVEQLRRRTFLESRSLAQERERSDRLLHNILPEQIAERLRQDPAAIADGADSVTVVFADVVGFTPMAADLPPTALVRLLDELFSEFDAVCREHGVEKIKTIGDAYMAVAGVPTAAPDHAEAAARVAIGFLEVADRFQGWPGHLNLRVGLSSGPAVAGVIGRDKFAYDLWGDTVNTAARMESHGHPGRVQVSEETRRLLDGSYRFTAPRITEIKGKGALTTYFIER